jgi:hypothetical protein
MEILGVTPSDGTPRNYGSGQNKRSAFPQTPEQAPRQVTPRSVVRDRQDQARIGTAQQAPAVSLVTPDDGRYRNVPDDGSRMSQTPNPARYTIPQQEEKGFWEKLMAHPDLGDGLTTFGLSLLAADAPGLKGLMQNIGVAGLNTQAKLDRNADKRIAGTIAAQQHQFEQIKFLESMRQFEKTYGAKMVQAAIESVDPNLYMGDQTGYYDAIQQRLEILNEYAGGGGEPVVRTPTYAVDENGRTVVK